MLYWAVRYPNGLIVGYNGYDKDQIILYRGLFSVPTYFVWYSAADKGNYLNIGDMFEFMVFEAPRPKVYNDPDYVDDFIVESIIFDVEKKCFKITCVNYFWKILSTKRLLSSIYPGTRDNPATGIETIEHLLEVGWRNQARMAQVSAIPTIRNNSNVKYSMISVDPEVSILDLIGKICADNGWEWYLGAGGYGGFSATSQSRVNTIYVGKRIRAEGRWVFPFNIEEEHCQRIETSSYLTITTEAIWCEPLLIFGKPVEGRVIWTKMYINNSGCMMTLMIQKTQHDDPDGIFPILNENDFILTLDAGYGRDLSLTKIWKTMRSFAVLIGKIYGEIPDDKINDYEFPNWSGDLKTKSKDLNHRSFITEYAEDEKPIVHLKNTKLSTPYAGNGVGLLFPQTEGHKTLLVPDGEREMALLGPGYFGPEDEVPARNYKNDFRLQLPGDTAIYYNSQSQTLYIAPKEGMVLTEGGMTPSDRDPQIVAKSITIDGDSILISDENGAFQIEIKNNEIKLGPKVIIEGDLQVQGTTQSSDFKTVIIPSVNAKLPTKVPPG